MTRRHHPSCGIQRRPEVANATHFGLTRRDPHPHRQPNCRCAPIAVSTAARLDAVADQLNGRPRKTLNWRTPTEELATLLDAIAA